MASNRRYLMGCLVGIPLVCGLGGLALYQTAIQGAQKERDGQLRLAHAAGLPIEPAELGVMVRVPESENAAPIYRRIAGLLEDGKPQGRAMRTLRNGWGATVSAKRQAEAAQAFETLRPALELARQAAALPHADFGRDWSKADAMSFPEMTAIRGVVSLLCYDAERRSAGGDAAGALADLREAARVAGHAGEDPVMIGMMVQISGETLLHRSFQKVIQDHRNDRAFLTSALDFAKDIGPLPNVRRALKGEFVLQRATLLSLKSLQAISPMSSGPEDPNTPHFGAADGLAFRSPIVRARIEANLLRYNRELITSLPDDPSHWEEGYQAALSEERKVNADRSATNTINRMLFPSASHLAQAVGQLIAQRHLSETTLRLLLEPSLPAALPDYGPTRIDPMSGAPLKYRREGDGFLLYSLGPDGKDNSGKSSQNTPWPPSGDVVRITSGTSRR